MPYNEPTSYDKHFGIGISPFITVDSDAVRSITVDSDMPNQGPNVALDNGARVKARSANTGNVYFSFDSGVDSTGYELAGGDAEYIQIQNLNELWFYSDTAGNQVVVLKA